MPDDTSNTLYPLLIEAYSFIVIDSVFLYVWLSCTDCFAQKPVFVNRIDPVVFRLKCIVAGKFFLFLFFIVKERYSSPIYRWTNNSVPVLLNRE